MANNKSVPFRVPRTNTTRNFQSEVVEIDESSAGVKKTQVRWTDEMDETLILTLVEQVLAGPRRANNGFTSAQLKKIVDKVNEKCHLVIAEKNMRARLKTLKKEYADLNELFSSSGLGWDPNTGRITAAEGAWEDHIKRKPEAEKLRGKVYIHYGNLGIIFGDDDAKGDRAVTGHDISSNIGNDTSDLNKDEENDEEIHQSPSISSKRASQIEGAKAARKQRRIIDDASSALSAIAESSKKIANALETQASQTHINWQMIVEKLECMNIEKDNIFDIMQLFEKELNLARIFLSFNNDDFSRDWILRKLGQAPPS